MIYIIVGTLRVNSLRFLARGIAVRVVYTFNSSVEPVSFLSYAELKFDRPHSAEDRDPSLIFSTRIIHVLVGVVMTLLKDVFQRKVPYCKTQSVMLRLANSNILRILSNITLMKNEPDRASAI